MLQNRSVTDIVRSVRRMFGGRPRAAAVLITALLLAAVPLIGSARTASLSSPSAGYVGSATAGGHYDYAGLIHVHTTYSDDATGTYEDLARVAGGQGIRFVVVTDHETLKAIGDGKQGWRNGVLMLTGVENARPEGHLLGMGISNAPNRREVPTTAYLQAVKAQDGLSILAHPAHRKWAWEGPVDERIDGIEILDLADQFYAAPLEAKLAAVAMLPVNRMAGYLELGTKAEPALRIWDRITQQRRFVGLYAADLHQAIELWGEEKMVFPPAEDVMRIARNHIVSAKPFSGEFTADADLVYGAIRAGHLYVAVDVLGDSTGFMFKASNRGGEAWMGDEIRAAPGTRYTVELPESAQRLEAVVRVLRNGIEVARSAAGQRVYQFVDDRPGIYRVEVTTMVPTAFGPDREMTWIYANPIYARDAAV
ncbi:MAG: PHP domain protein [bacterium]|nr:MAG: PHP domain protein [bacterium]